MTKAPRLAMARTGRRSRPGILALLALAGLSGCGEEPSQGKSAPAQATPPILQRPEAQGPETRGRETRGPETRGPQTRGPETRGPDRSRRDETEMSSPRPRDQSRTGTRDTGGASGSTFDFYVLSLSWSPTWCAQNDPTGKTMQCNGNRDYRYVVHGLWPQNEAGFPAFCRSREGDRVPDALGRSLFDIIPSMGLIGHQWRKHGTCSGLSQEAYFALLRQARARIRIPAVLDEPDSRRRMTPAAIESALSQSNPGLSPQALAVTCDKGQLDEIRICLTRDLAFRACGEVDRGGCRARDITIPSALSRSP